MSLIYTADLSRANPFDYLTELQRHAADLARAPARWLPWNYSATLLSPTNSVGMSGLTLLIFDRSFTESWEQR
ncbi:MAG TPA: hypothetical protein VI837_02440 [Blastocatellia bacterium]|nr:hypothetical protein [Blastocatellia bacterium]